MYDHDAAARRQVEWLGALIKVEREHAEARMRSVKENGVPTANEFDHEWAERTAALVPDDEHADWIASLSLLVSVHHETFTKMLLVLGGQGAQSRAVGTPKTTATKAKAGPSAKQDRAEVRGWGYVSGLSPDKAEELVRLLPTLSTDTFTVGSREGREPTVEPDGRVKVALAYGPVRGAHPSDLRKKLQAAADKVQPGATVEVAGTARGVVADPQ